MVKAKIKRSRANFELFLEARAILSGQAAPRGLDYAAPQE
jgi:hypothetical protein